MAMTVARRRATLVAAMAGAAGTAVFAIAQGASVTTAPVVGCVARGGGLRIVSATSTCHRAERRLRWNVSGATGPAGATGRSGVRGVPGHPGAAGAAGSAGARGAVGATGARGVFRPDDFQGMSCTSSGTPGTISMTYDPQGYASYTC